jgi:anti-anti-sigma factor
MLKPTVQVHHTNGFLVAEFWDCLRLDPGPVQELRTKYEAHLRAKGRPELIIDLLGVGFAGSASLGHFVALHRLAKPKNGRLIFCNVDPQVFEVFRLSKLEPMFGFVSDRAAALSEAAKAETAAADEVSDAAPDASAIPADVKTVPKAQKAGGNGLMHSNRRKKLL